MANSDSGKLISVTDVFSFQSQADIQIPKNRREIAYVQSVDFIARTSSIEAYLNNRADPPISFFGYAVLVFQDCLSLEIPLHQPRQRIWFDRNVDALTLWQMQAYIYALKSQIQSATAPLYTGSEGAYQDLPLPNFGFLELPLREVHVKTLPFCGFDLEYTQTQPVPFTDNQSITRTGASGQTDSTKDKGLPTAGISPRITSPSDPYLNQPNNGIPSADNGFLLSPPNLSGNNPDNSPPAGYGYFAHVVVSYYDSGIGKTCAQMPCIANGYYLINSTDSLSVTKDDTAPNHVCDNDVFFWTVHGSYSGVIAAHIPSTYAPSVAVVRAAALPPNTDSCFA